MKKIKWTIMTIAVLFSIVSAFSFRPHPMQTGLYYLHAGIYSPVNGTEGIGWICETSASICTYSKSGQTYTPYQTGATYFSLAVAPATPASTPKTEPQKKGK